MTAGIAAQGITVRLGGRTVLDDAAIAVAPTELVGLVGPNGAGKTTMLRALAGLLAPDGGTVLLGGTAVGAIDPRALARDLAYLPHGAPCHWRLPVERVVALGRLPHQGRFGRPASGDGDVIEAALHRAGVVQFRDRPVQTLSAGERARVMIARALAQEPRVLLADEPTVALDPYHQLRVLDLLRDRAAAGAAVVAVLHDLSLAARFCSRIVLLVAGRVAADGSPAEVLTPARLRAAYGVDVIVGDPSERTYVLPPTEQAAGS